MNAALVSFAVGTLGQHDDEQRQRADRKGNQRGIHYAGQLTSHFAVHAGLQRQHGSGDQGQGEQPPDNRGHGIPPIEP